MDLTPEIQSTYKVTNNTFIHQVLDKPGHDLQVQIGDINSPTFKPHINITKWKNEVNLGVEFIETDLSTPNITTSNNKILYQKPSYIVSFSSIDSDGMNFFEYGGHEFDITYNAKPSSNIVSFTINANNLNFFYQPPLTADDIAQGSTQPENIAGSYAVYHASKAYNQVGGNQYFTGKVCHIYRPLITDNLGNTIYGELNISNGIMAITIPQDFLDTAIYPVVVDPTFGYTSAGASNAGLGTDLLQASGSGYLGAAGKGSSMSIYTNSPTNLKLGIYNASNSNLVDNTASFTQSGSASWNTSNLSGAVLSAITYYLAFIAQVNNGSIAYDLNDSVNSINQSVGSYTLPSTASFGSGASKVQFSIYATYSLPPASIPVYSVGITPQPNIGVNVIVG